MVETTHRSLFGPALRGIFAALGSDVAQKVLGLGSTLIVLSVLQPYDYGLWQLLLSVLTAFDVILLPSIATMLIADISREIGEGRKNRAGAIVVRAIPLFVLLGIAAATIMALVAPFVTQTSGIDVTLWVMILAGALVAEGVGQSYQLVLQGTLSLAHAQVLKILKRLFYVVGIGLLLFLFDLGLTGVVIAYVMSLAVPLVLYAPVVIPRFFALTRGREGGHGHFFSAVWGRGRWPLLGDFMVAAAASISPWIIGYYLSIAEVGYISLATMILGQVTSLAPISFILRSILPRTLATEGRTRAWLARSMKYAIWSQMLGGLGVVGGTVLVIPIFFPAYTFVVPIVAALIITLPIRSMGAVASEWFVASRRQRTLFLASNLPKVLLLALLPVFLSLLGMLGFVLHAMVSADLLTYLRLRIIAKEQGSRLRLQEILFPDKEDQNIFGRVLDSFYKIRYTRL